MNDTSLAKDFPGASEQAWRALVEKALKGAQFDDALVTRTHDGLTIKPLYTRQDEIAPDEAGLPGHAPFGRALRPLPGEPPWDIRQLQATTNPSAANKNILADLAGGATSITLRLAAPEQSGIDIGAEAGLTAVLEGVYPDMITIGLEPGANFADAARALMAYWAQHDLANEDARGSFGADPLGSLARTGVLPFSLDQALEQAAALAHKTAEDYPSVTALLVDGRPYHDGGAGEADELACMAATLVAYLRAAEDAGLTPEQSLGQISFVLAADADQFLTIAKLRAARIVINGIAEACSAQATLSGLRIQVQTSARMMTRRDPHVNLLRTTTAAAAAALGGADAITVLPYSWSLGEPDALARRIARNIQLILQEESSLGRVLDSAGGSWYVEALTRELAQTAWERFQAIESEGGIAKALAKGTVQATIRETAEARRKAVAIGAEELVGVSAFAQIAEPPTIVEPRKPPEPIEDPAVTVEPIPLRRPAEPFERLRDQADAFVDQTGAKPLVFLANLGTLADASGPSNYAANLFAAGGVEAVSSEPFASAEAAASAFKSSGAKIACLCSSAEVYASMGAETARALTDAGADYIFLAGRPGDLREQLMGAGVRGFIHKGCDMVETLETAQDVLGVGRR